MPFPNGILISLDDRLHACERRDDRFEVLLTPLAAETDGKNKKEKPLG